MASGISMLRNEFAFDWKESFLFGVVTKKIEQHFDRMDLQLA